MWKLLRTASSVVGLASLVKVILAAQHGVIPPQCNYSSPNPNIEAIREGKVIVVTDPTELQGIYYNVSRILSTMVIYRCKIINIDIFI